MTSINLEEYYAHVEQGLITCRKHQTEDLLIWNYTPKCQYTSSWDECTMAARGLITDLNGRIIARPFPKFFSIEQYPELPLESFKVTEKLDGSLGILYQVNGAVAIATRGSFTSDQATKANQILQKKYSDYSFHPSYTYLFEIIYPANRIVVDYGSREDLILLAVIETATGNELNIHPYPWPFPVAKQYDGVTDLKAIAEMNQDNAEGFVIHFESGLRVKAKFAEYKRLHKILTGINEVRIWEMLKNNQDTSVILDVVPDEFYNWVQSIIADLEGHYKAIEKLCIKQVALARNLLTRKEQAMMLKSHIYSGVMFAMLDNKPYAEMIWKQLKPKSEKSFKEDEE